MCGIFGYVGPRPQKASVIADGLKRLEYRGYDSWGIAVLDDDILRIQKNPGVIHPEEVDLPVSTSGVGHTRWATHGAVSKTNAHPHIASDKSFALVQNGIVQNMDVLKSDLEAQGYMFISQTDTEVIVHLLESYLKKEQDFKKALASVFETIEGRNTVAVVTKDGKMYAVRNGSPLIVGRRGDTVFISSDSLSLSPYTDEIAVVDNGVLIAIQDDGVTAYSLDSLNTIELDFVQTAKVETKIDKEGFDHFMLKEIYESPHVIRSVAQTDKDLLFSFADDLKQSKGVYTVGSGTAGLAAEQMAYYLQAIGGIHATSMIGAESKKSVELLDQGDIVIAPSQSGETADVLEVLEIAQENGVKIASYVNMVGSMMSRMSDYAFYANAGPEICVMSTKVFTSQIAWGYLVAKTVADDYDDAVTALQGLADTMHTLLEDSAFLNSIKKLAHELATKEHIFLLAKGQNLAVVKEAMVKIIEGSYIHAHAIPAGDLKHYAITLMEEGVPVVFLMSDDQDVSDTFNAVAEVKARGATTIGIGEKVDEGFDYALPMPDTHETSAILHAIAVQLLAYYMALEKGNPIDKPRNIAKSVTVK